MFRKLRLRLTIACALITCLVLTGMAMVPITLVQNQLVRQSEETFLSNLNAIFAYLRSQTYIDHAWLAQTEAAESLYISIEDAGKPLLYNSLDPQRSEIATSALQISSNQYAFDYGRPPDVGLQPEYVQFLMDYQGSRYRAAVCNVPTGSGWLGVTVFKSMAAEDAQIRNLRLSFTGVVLLAVICLCAFAWFFTSRAVRPVEESRLRQAEFISAASHELRAPLAVMRASAGAIQSAQLSQARAFARNIEMECAQLSSLAEDLLSLAGADSHRWSMEFGWVEPDTLLLNLSERFEPVAHQKEVTLRVELPDAALPRLRCDAQRVEQLLTILLDNALRYTPPGGRITLAARATGRRLLLSVADNGPGVPDEQKGRVFDRFHRGDSSRSEKGHYGLGLSIAQEIAQLHRGRLTVEDAPEGGARFVLTLPLHN